MNGIGSNPRFSMCMDSAKGLYNGPGDNNCFMNSSVQILWHLDSFRCNFRQMSAHACTGSNCVFCSLKEILTSYQFSDQPILSSASLRHSLASTFKSERRFQLGAPCDASECYETILDRLHDHVTDSENESNCRAQHCISHQKLSMHINEMISCTCGACSKPLQFQQPVYYVSTTALLLALSCSTPTTSSSSSSSSPPTSSLSSPPSSSSPSLSSSSSSLKCFGVSRRLQILTKTPEVTCLGFVWDTHRPSADQLRGILKSIDVTIAPREVSCHDYDDENGDDDDAYYNLAGVISYHHGHYCTFIFHSKQHVWYQFDDGNVQMLDNQWETVVKKCLTNKYQPLLLFYTKPRDLCKSVSMVTAFKQTFFRSCDLSTSGWLIDLLIG
ncbi:hypothetical protein HELRODRAFT_75478 [Helobdella robusta]|uniref:USP domain-containing protein n=1 Tax=Helobdella robusta TaxID=6412 RepID=T1G256_HELRO|nr:hypothetical protein HELRODRAFT_75478 [Helobdella robusta]ESO07962.1 hypothetical protein HELRODRAFT_75478 [Helobdella robusta]